MIFHSFVAFVKISAVCNTPNDVLLIRFKVVNYAIVSEVCSITVAIAIGNWALDSAASHVHLHPATPNAAVLV